MAERRMFAKTIIDSDAFLDMPVTSQLLYFHLSMRADDDGFVNKPKSIMRMTGTKDDDIKLLFAKKFLIPFDSGVVVIKHWKIHNYIRRDTYTKTKYQEELASLETDENNAYRLSEPVTLAMCDESVTSSSRVRDGYVDTGKDRLGKDSIGKVSIEEDSILSDSDEPEPPAPKAKKPVKHKYGEYNNVLLTDEELEKLQSEFPDWKERIERLSSYVASTGKSYKSHYATIRNWARKDAQAVPQNIRSQSQTQPKKQSEYNDFMAQLAALRE